MLKTALLLVCLAAPSQAAPTFIQEPGVRLSSAVLTAAAPILGGTRYYYIRGSTQTTVYSAVSPDNGLGFTEEVGVRLTSSTLPSVGISSITGLSVMPLTAGGYRMIYSAITTAPGGSSYSIQSATSSDGLGWANDSGVRLANANGAGGFVGSPALVVLANGKWRLYYTANTDNTANPANRQIYTALSSDQGLTFPTTAQAFAAQAGDVAAMQRTDGRIRILYTAPLTGATTNSLVLSALSTLLDVDGSLFAAENTPALPRFSTTSASGFLGAPFLVRSTDTWRWRMYYNFTPFAAAVSTADVFSASAFAPDPVTMTPHTVLRTNTDTVFAVKGESFSAAPTLQLKQGNSTINPSAAVAVTDDQNLSVTFNMLNQPLGDWSLIATNDNGASSTLTKAVFVDFAAGSVTLTDNLMRPRQGTRTQIDANTFNGGRLVIKLFTLRGEPVATLLDAEEPSGTTTVFWDGKTAQGHNVASGVYLLRVIGQKIDIREKIVVIK